MIVSVCSLGFYSVVITSLYYYRALHVVYTSCRAGDETVAALEVLFTGDAVSPDGFSQTAYIILHANIGSVFFKRIHNLIFSVFFICHFLLCLYIISFFFFLYLSLPLWATSAQYEVNAFLVLHRKW